MNTIEHIRRNVFRATQSEFASIASVTQATVSRWENGTLKPALTEMQAIRDAATMRDDVVWSDSLFFEIPEEAPQPAPMPEAAE